MRKVSFDRLLLAGLLLCAGTTLRGADEQDLITTLQSAASVPQKWAACQSLRLHGTARAVPALAALLEDERLSQAARHTLEALPGPEAEAALDHALLNTSGFLKAGIIDSIGWRGNPASVSLLTPLLSDSDPVIAGAAAGALGRFGGQDALAALSAARDQAPASVQPTLLESLLKCAERRLANNDAKTALRVYRDLFDPKYPAQIRIAAWRGLALADSEHRAELVIKALGGTDRSVQNVALKLLRETSDAPLLEVCAGQWGSLPAQARVAVIEGQVRLNAQPLATARLASRDAVPLVRIAAWRALCELNDFSSIPVLAKAAAQGDPAEREAARQTLLRLRGPGAGAALLAEIEKAAPPEKAELLRALGQRGDQAAVGVLLKNAGSDVELVRLASLDALGRLATPEAAEPLMDMAAKSASGDERAAVLRALNAACDAAPDKQTLSRRLVSKLQHLPDAERIALLPLLPELATPGALEAARSDSLSSNVELAKEAVRVLAQWPTAVPAVSLLELARDNPDPNFRILALRGAIQVAGLEPDPAKRLGLLGRALAVAGRLDEKKQALGQIGQTATPEALDLALSYIPVPGLGDEAISASLSVAEKLAPSNPALANLAAEKVLARVSEGEIARRAWNLHRKPGAEVPFIRDWLVCGPYRQAGAVGAKALFDIPFGPEKRESPIDWKTVPVADHADLAGIFPGQENCAAYLRTRVVAAQDGAALLLLGSDDGVKAWLNGKVIHRNNIDRGEVADQDIVPIQLKKGPNDLLLKITQGGGGWSACARIAGTDFKPIPGLQFQGPTDGGSEGVK